MRRNSPIHVCSLSTSSLTIIKKQLEEEEAQYSKLSPNNQVDQMRKLDKLRWVQLSMAYYRQVQLQNVFQHLGDKGNNPRFRAVRMRPLFQQWKREVLRQNWEQLRSSLDLKALRRRLEQKKDFFSSQRTELTSRFVANNPKINNPPLECLIPINGPLKDLLSFQTPNSNRPGFYNKGYDYCASDAVKTLSEVPEDEGQDDWYQKEESIKSRSIPLNLESDDEIPIESSNNSKQPSVKSISNQKPIEKPQEKVEPIQKQPINTEIKKSENNFNLYIIILIGLIFAILIFFILNKSNSINKPISTPIPTPIPTPTPTPIPTPKSFFSFLGF